MSFQDRHYQGDRSSGFGGGGFTPAIGMPKPTPIVKYLLIINIAVYLVQTFLPGRLEALFVATPAHPFQIWRLITFQFLHGSFGHILFNMLGLYFLGPVLERQWGSDRFLKFYLISGFVGGLLFVLAGQFGVQGFVGSLVGASGGVLALLVACAILYPQFRVYIFFIFPVSIRLAAVLFTIWYFLNVLQSGPNAGGDLCHLGGMATGFIWVMAGPWLQKHKQRSEKNTFANQMGNSQQLQYELDRILAKVHDKGLNSLTRKEKQTLQDATDQQKGH